MKLYFYAMHNQFFNKTFPSKYYISNFYTNFFFPQFVLLSPLFHVWFPPPNYFQPVIQPNPHSTVSLLYFLTRIPVPTPLFLSKTFIHHHNPNAHHSAILARSSFFELFLLDLLKKWSRAHRQPCTHLALTNFPYLFHAKILSILWALSLDMQDLLLFTFSKLLISPNQTPQFLFSNYILVLEILSDLLLEWALIVTYLLLIKLTKMNPSV